MGGRKRMKGEKRSEGESHPIMAGEIIATGVGQHQASLVCPRPFPVRLVGGVKWSREGCATCNDLSDQLKT